MSVAFSVSSPCNYHSRAQSSRLPPRCYLGAADWNAGCEGPRHMLPGAAKFGFGVPGSRTRLQDWKSFSPASPDAGRTVADTRKPSRPAGEEHIHRVGRA